VLYLGCSFYTGGQKDNSDSLPILANCNINLRQSCSLSILRLYGELKPKKKQETGLSCTDGCPSGVKIVSLPTGDTTNQTSNNVTGFDGCGRLVRLDSCTWHRFDAIPLYNTNIQTLCTSNLKTSKPRNRSECGRAGLNRKRLFGYRLAGAKAQHYQLAPASSSTHSN